MKTLNSFLIDRALSGSKVNQRIQYWKSYEDHKERIRKELKEERACIKDIQETIKELEEELVKVEEEEKAFTESDYKPSVEFSEETIAKNPEFWNTMTERIKEHELRWHPGLVGNFYISDGVRGRMNEKKPEYSVISRIYDPYSIKEIRCETCYKQWLQDTKQDSHFTIRADTEPGAKF